MTDSKPDPRQEACDRAIRTGGIPIDPYPGYLTWFFRHSVERGAGAGLDLLCRMFPEREDAILETWCRLSTRTGDRWAWKEARALLERLIVAQQFVPCPLARFAIVPEPHLTTGPERSGSRDLMLDLMAWILETEGFDAGALREQFGQSFPNPDRKDAASTLYTARRRAAAYMNPVFGSNGGDGAEHAAVLQRPVSLAYDWNDLDEAARVLLTSGWPAFAVLWELWPDRCKERLGTWCDRARTEFPMWAEMRALLDHTVYCRWTVRAPLSDFISFSPPTSRAQPKFGFRIRLAGVERALEERGQSQLSARRLCAAALGHSNVRDHTLQKDFSEGRERLGRLIS